jgi:hypothetical protein
MKKSKVWKDKEERMLLRKMRILTRIIRILMRRGIIKRILNKVRFLGI